MHRYRELLSGLDGVTVPYEDAEVDVSSCYVMPVIVDDAALRDPLRSLHARGAQGADQRALPGLHELTAYADRAAELPAASSWVAPS